MNANQNGNRELVAAAPHMNNNGNCNIFLNLKISMAKLFYKEVVTPVSWSQMQKLLADPLECSSCLALGSFKILIYFRTKL